MSAADFQVSRLERAKADLLDLVGALRGDRIGLVAFAGRAEVRCPLTFDYGFFRHILGELEIGSVSLGGTSIAQAIHKGLETFQDEYPNHKALLLITDGEDHEEFVKEAIDRARQKNVRIFAVGVGDWKEGRRIPIVDENGVTRYLQDASGKEVWTKLNPRLLQLAASETGGAYVGTGTGGFDMVELYKNYIDTMEKTDLGGYKEEKYKDRFQWFLGLGLFLLALEPLVSTRRSRLKPPPETAQERAS
jgi:Ca-activated chloride channel family protein